MSERARDLWRQACDEVPGIPYDPKRLMDAALRAINRAIAEERERCAALAEKWRDENKAAAAKARKRDQGGVFEPTGMAEMLDCAASECNALAAAIRKGSDNEG